MTGSDRINSGLNVHGDNWFHLHAVLKTRSLFVNDMQLTGDSINIIKKLSEIPPLRDSSFTHIILCHYILHSSSGCKS